MKKLIAMVIDTEKNEIRKEEIDDDINAFYKVLNCECFDIAHRPIGGKPYDILCDDMGLYRENPVVSAVNPFNMRDFLVGNLIILKHKGEDLESLTHTDVMRIYGHCGSYKFTDEINHVAVMLG